MPNDKPNPRRDVLLAALSSDSPRPDREAMLLIEASAIQQKTTEYVREHWGEYKCPVCGAFDWGVAEPLRIDTWAYSESGVGILVPISCKNCSNTIMFNPIIAGIVDPNEPPS